MPKWISVGERLPEEGETCWISDKTYGVIDGYFKGMGEGFDSSLGFYSEEYCDPLGPKENPTHWMPLNKPEPPE